MKKLVMTVLVALALGTSAVMADRDGMGGPRGGKGGPMSHLQSQLSLTDAQMEQLKTMRDEQRKQMDAAHTATQARIAQILTADQATKFKEMTDKMEQRRAEREKRMAEGKGGRGEFRGHHEGRGHGGHGFDGHKGRGHGGPDFAGKGGPRGPGAGGDRMVSRLTDDLKLTPEQVTQVQAIMKDQQAQMDQFRQASKDSLVKLLTPDQATKFQSLQNERKQRMQEQIKNMQQRLERM